MYTNKFPNYIQFFFFIRNKTNIRACKNEQWITVLFIEIYILLKKLRLCLKYRSRFTIVSHKSRSYINLDRICSGPLLIWQSLGQFNREIRGIIKHKSQTMPTKRYRRDQSEVSCCLKYVIFGFNVIFWVSLFYINITK